MPNCFNIIENQNIKGKNKNKNKNNIRVITFNFEMSELHVLYRNE